MRRSNRKKRSNSSINYPLKSIKRLVKTSENRVRKSVKKSRRVVRKSVKKSRRVVRKSVKKSRHVVRKSVKKSRRVVRKSVKRSRRVVRKSLTKSRRKYKRKQADGVIEIVEASEPEESEGEIFYTAPTYYTDVIIVPFENQVQNLPEVSKFFKMKKQPIPLQAIKNKMLSENINPDIIDLDPDGPLTIPLRPVIVEKPKTVTEKKTFFLDNIKETEFWKKSLKNLINQDDFKKKFITKNTNNIKDTIVKKVETTETKIKPILSMDSKVRQATEITYRKLINMLPKTMNVNEKHDYIINIFNKKSSDISDNDFAILYLIPDFIPNKKDDLEKYKLDFENNNALLKDNKVLDFEKLIKRILDTKQLYEKIEMYKFKIEGTISLNDINKNIQKIINIMNIYKENTLFHTILGVLKEFINLGGHKGGFSLLALPNLVTFKSQDKKSILLDYLIDIIINKHTYNQKELDDLESIKLIINLSIPEFEKVIQKSEKFNNDVVKNIDNEIYLNMQTNIEQSKSMLELLKVSFNDLLAFYGENTTDIDIATYVKNLNSFITSFAPKFKSEYIKKQKREKLEEQKSKKILKSIPSSSSISSIESESSIGSINSV